MEGEATPRLLYPMEIFIILFGVGVVGWVIWAAASGKMFSGGGSGSAPLTAFHDFQPRDKQEAVEVIIDQRAGKRWEQQNTGEGKNESEHNNEP